MPTDASITFKNFRRQLLYIIHRVLATKENIKFRPEYLEDLAILDADGNLVEVVQVKDQQKLSPSDFRIKSKESFICRCSGYIEREFITKIKLCSFQDVSPKLVNAISEKGNDRMSSVKSIVNENFLSVEDVENVLDRIELEAVDEDEILNDIKASIAESSAGIDQVHALDVLFAWIYNCSEHQRVITRTDLVKEIDGIGNLLSDRAAHHEVWFSLIKPIVDIVLSPEERDKLAKGFYQGLGAQYRHILVGLDVRRQWLLELVHEGFSESNIVIIHSASGQGKSTLAYRYIHDYFPGVLRYEVGGIRSTKDARTVARAIRGHSSSLGLPFLLYLDVSPKDQEWTDILKELSQYTDIKILITVREEDWKRADLMPHELASSFIDIELELRKDEAKKIYIGLSRIGINPEILSFEEAWEKFGEKGPLLEFVHLVTQGQTLESRLKQQITRIANDSSLKKAFDLLHYVCVADYLGAPLYASKTFASIGIKSHLSNDIQYLEKEYLIQYKGEEGILEGLHPIRSGIIVNLLYDSDFQSLDDLVCNLLSLIVKSAMKVYLLNAFLRLDNPSKLIIALKSHSANSWSEKAAILEALLWFGVNKYVLENRKVFIDFHETTKAKPTILGLDISDAMKEPVRFEEIMNNDNAEYFQQCRSILSDKSKAFIYAKEWISSDTTVPIQASGDTDIDAIGKYSYWNYRFDKPIDLEEWLDIEQLALEFSNCNLNSVAQCVLGLWEGCYFRERYWLNEIRPELISRFKYETLSPIVIDDGRTIKILFILQMDDTGSEQKLLSSTSLHEAALLRVELLRSLFPDRDTYCTKGEGFNLFGQFGDISKGNIPDDTIKKIPKANLANPIAIKINSLYRALVEHLFRPERWIEYIDNIIKKRREGLGIITIAISLLEKYFKSSKYKNFITKKEFSQCSVICNNLAKDIYLPKSAVDIWGYISEFTNERSMTEGEASQMLWRQVLSLQRYRPWLKCTGEYSHCIEGFSRQFLYSFVYNAIIGRQKGVNRAKLKEFVQESDTPKQHIRNCLILLENLYNILPEFHKEFRELFIGRIEVGDISELEKDELIKVNNLLALWVEFANFPHKRFSTSPISRAKSNIENAKKRLIRSIEDTLDEHRCSRFTAKWTGFQVPWENENTWFIVVDSKSPDVLNSAQIVYELIKTVLIEAFRTNHGETLIKTKFRQIGILPLFRGKAIAPSALALSWYKLIENSTTSFLIDLPRELSRDQLRSISVETWENKYIQRANDFMFAYIKSIGIMQHMNILSDVVLCDEESKKVTKDYIAKNASALSDQISRFYNISTKMIDHLRDLLRSGGPMDLFSDYENSFKKINDILRPSKSNGKVYHVDISELNDWVDKLLKGVEIVENIYLLYIENILQISD